jgi:outer membrane lipoprotein-sorting protein
MKKLLFLSLFFIQVTSYSQDANQLLKRVVAKITSVKDYSVDASIKTDIPFIKILPVKAKIYFKQKDKFKIVSKGIVILPKQGFTDVNAFLSKTNSYMAVDGGTKMIGELKTSLITVIPTNENSEFVLAKLWIDPKNAVIISSQITTRSSGTVNVDYFYTSELAFGLPSKLIFEIDIKKFKMPKSVAADINNDKPKDKSKKKTADKKGIITIKLSNYVINKGINDAIFEKK